jgi:AraC family transcriptional regulator
MIGAKTSASMAARARRTLSRALSNRDAARLFAHIEENIAATLSIADLARTVGLPIASLRQQFHQYTGQSVHRYSVERRLQLACKLLTNPDSSIPDIAAASGFSSQQHMTMAFRNRLGTTPKLFQRANAGP